jgi:nuclear pore complex protein Nup155
LQEVVGDFQQLDFAKGTLELPLACAQVFDPIASGFQWWQAGMPAGDTRSELYERRSRCYDLILDSLSVFEDKVGKAEQSKAVNIGDVEAVRTNAYELAFASTDELFHSRLYDWLTERQLADDLLEASLIAYLCLRIHNQFRFGHRSWSLISDGSRYQ